MSEPTIHTTQCSVLQVCQCHHMCVCVLTDCILIKQIQGDQQILGKLPSNTKVSLDTQSIDQCYNMVAFIFKLFYKTKVNLDITTNNTKVGKKNYAQYSNLSARTNRQTGTYERYFAQELLWIFLRNEYFCLFPRYAFLGPKKFPPY